MTQKIRFQVTVVLNINGDIIQYVNMRVGRMQFRNLMDIAVQPRFPQSDTNIPVPKLKRKNYE